MLAAAAERRGVAAMVLAAGLGTRLRPLTEELPKPLCPIGDRAPIDRILATLARAGFGRVVVNTHHLPGAFDDAWRTSQPVALVMSHEPEILGTGGAIAHASALLGDGGVLVWNADILATPDLDALLPAADGAAVARVLVTPVAPGRPGTMGLAADGRVVRLRGQRFGEEVREVDYAGIAWISAGLRGSLPTPGCLVGDGYLPALGRGERIDAIEHGGGFTDVGSLEGYLEANLAWLADAGWTSFVHPRATVERAVSVQRSVVGKGAVVSGTGKLVDCVVWPGARAVAPLERCVVTRARTVRVDAAES